MDRKGQGRRAVVGFLAALPLCAPGLAFAADDPDDPANPDADECVPSDKLDVLLLGNSYTNMGDLRGVLESLGTQAGMSLSVSKLATGGADFEKHLARSKTAQVIAEGSWDAVVLQSHSLDTIRNPDGFARAGRKLVTMVQATGARPVLFQTWPRMVGHNLYGYMKKAGGSPAAMLSIVKERYAALADATGAEVAPVGEAWLAALAADPKLRLHASDKNHPGRLGTYLTANVLFATLTDVTPVGNVSCPADIATPMATQLQAIAASVCAPSCESV